MLRIFLVMGLVFTGVVAVSASEDLGRQVRLVLSQDDDGLVAEFKNFSQEKATFFFHPCPLCFWSYSLDQGPWQPLVEMEHRGRCRLTKNVVLEPGETWKHTLDSRLFNRRGLLRVRYQYQERGAYLESEAVDRGYGVR
ncbi:MAG: hypothetical protein HQL21_04720 [Candidatus Omnitrophica bacterium]|nr:hypothetical protein [Candidatus Omnitrophota bacterium]